MLYGNITFTKQISYSHLFSHLKHLPYTIVLVGKVTNIYVKFIFYYQSKSWGLCHPLCTNVPHKETCKAKCIVKSSTNPSSGSVFTFCRTRPPPEQHPTTQECVIPNTFLYFSKTSRYSLHTIGLPWDETPKSTSPATLKTTNGDLQAANNLTRIHSHWSVSPSINFVGLNIPVC